MLKIAHIVTAYSSAITILDSKLRALNAKSGLDVCVISSPADNREKKQPAVRHISVNMVRRIKPLADLKSIWQLYKVIRREKYDIVHSHTAKAGFIAAIAAKPAQVPLVLHTYHGLPFYQGQSRIAYIIYRFLEKVACRFRDCVFTQNKHDIPECIKLMGSEDRVLFEGNGVDVELVTKSASEQLQEAMKDYTAVGLKLALLSRLEPVKRVDDFFKVVEKLKQKGVEVSCVVAGTGFLEKQLKSKLVEMGLDDCVNMVGFTDHPHGLIAASDIVILCSEKEGIPRTIMEAMALQKPVVAMDVTGTQELVINGETGFLTPLGDIGAMVDKIKHLYTHPELRKRMGAAGMRRARQHFNDCKIATFLHDFYKQACVKG